MNNLNVYFFLRAGFLKLKRVWQNSDTKMNHYKASYHIVMPVTHRNEPANAFEYLKK
jgi:hypothetical protein